MLKRLCFVTVLVLAALVGVLRMEVWADIVVNEVLPNTGNDTELIELYNTIGSGNINVANWTFKDGGGNSDTIVAWSTRNPAVDLPGCDTTITNIPADSYAIILDPEFAGGHYVFPVGTIILTIENSSALGNGLGNSESITLFDDTGNTVSSYGGWIAASADISVERIDPDWLDVACNWTDCTDASGSTPGAINDVDADYTGNDPTGQFTVDGAGSATDSECHTFTFVDTSDSDGCQAITGWSWDFDGDGVPDTTAQNPTHQYTDNGTYTVTLTVTDAGGDTADTTAQVVVISANPTAEAGADIINQQTLTVAFTGSGTTDGCQSIDIYSWNFGDGNTGTGQNPSHGYTKAGTYIVTLTVTDSGGDTDSDTLTVTITEQENISLFGPGTMGVWEDYRNGNWDIYVHDLGPNEIYEPGAGDDAGDSQITSDTRAQQEPDVYIDANDTAWIVWTDFRNSAPPDTAYGDIYYTAYDTITGVIGGDTQVTTNPGHQGEPTIYGDTIVFVDGRNQKTTGWDLYKYNIGTATEAVLDNAPGDQRYPDIYSDTVVYQSDGDIHYINVNDGTGSGNSIVTGASRPAIDSKDGRYVAYQTAAGGVAVYDFTTVTSAAVATAANNPSVHNGKVVYEKGGHIYAYYIDAGTTYQVTTHSAPIEAKEPSIYGSAVSWQERNNPTDVWKINFAKLPDGAAPNPPTTVVEAGSCTGADLPYICSTTYYVYWDAITDTSTPPAGAGFSHYEIQENVNGGGWSASVRTTIGDINDTCYQVTGKTHSDSCEYQVSSVSKSGAASVWVSGTGIRVDTTLPSAPGQPKEGDGGVCVGGDDKDYDGNGSYQVFWSAPTDTESGIASYILQEKIGAGAWSTIFTPTTTCQAVSGKLHGNTYYYQVAAINGAGCDTGPWSTTSDGITIDTASPTPPSNVLEGDTVCSAGPDQTFDGDGSYQVKWDAAASTSGIVAYGLYERIGAGAWTLLTDTISGDSTCYDITGKAHGDTYSYKVLAKNGAGSWSDPSSPNCVSNGITVDTSPPPCPSPVSLEGGDATTSDTSQLSAAWGVPVDPLGTPITGYQYTIGTSPGDTSVLGCWSDTTDTGVTVTGLNLTNGDSYSFTVRAKDMFGRPSTENNNCSDSSDSITVYIDEWKIVWTVTASPGSNCTAGVNPNATAGFDAVYDEVAPPLGPDGYRVYFNHPEYPPSQEKLSTDIRKKVIPIEDTKDTWPLCIHTNIGGLTINLKKPNLIDVPLSLDVVLSENGSDTVIYIQFDGEDKTTSDTIYTFTMIGATKCFTLMVSGADSTPDEPAWLAERNDTFPNSGAEDDDYDSDGIFYVAWGTVPGAVGYELQQSTDGGTTWNTVQDSACDTYPEPNGIHNTTYEHRVRVRDNDGFYSFWIKAATITVDTTPPPKPTNLRTIPSGYSNDGTYVVCWDGVTDPESDICGYILKVSTDGGATWNDTGDTSTDTCRTFTGRTNDTYTYLVKARNCAENESDSSDTVAIIVDSIAPTVPANVIEGDYACSGTDSAWDADGSYSISWDAVNEATLYQIIEGKSGTTGTTWSGTTSDTCTSVTGRDTGTYYYKVKAKDGAGNWTVYSSMSNGIKVGAVSYCSNFAADWSMISIPVDPMYPDPEDNFTCLGTGTCMLIGCDTGYKVEDSLSLGEGYWLWSKDALTNICFTGAPLSELTGDSYSIPIKAGWNLIGCPYTADRADFSMRNGVEKTMADAITAGWTTGDFFTHDQISGNYVSTPGMSPYAGYWFGSTVNGELLVMDIAELGVPSFPASPKESDFLLKITASSGKTRTTAELGLDPYSEEGLDQKDSCLPPNSPGDYISLYTNHPEAGIFSRFSRDVRRGPGLRQTKEFEFAVETNLTEEITLSWNPKEIKGYRAVLTDGAQKIDMKRASSYSYQSSSSQKTFTVELTEKESAPSQNTLLQNFPNPFNPECWIPFKLSEPAGHVEFRIYTITGQLVRTIDCGYRDDGDHVAKCDTSNKINGCAAYWDGYNAKGQEAASGVYFYQLVADGKVLTKKMVVLK